jgi:hypothetical protein
LHFLAPEVADQLRRLGRQRQRAIGGLGDAFALDGTQRGRAADSTLR